MPVVLPLVALDVLLVVLWTIAVALLIAVVMGYISGKLRGLPTPLNQIAGPVANLADGISNACWGAVKTAESAVGAAWHHLASYLEKALSQFVAHSAIIVHLAELVGSGIYSVSGLRSLVHTLEREYHGVEHGVKTLEKEWRGIEHRVRAMERELGAGIGNDVRSQVHTLEKEYKAVDKAVTDSLPKAINAAEGELTQLEQFIKALPGVRYLDWAAGIAIAAVGTEVFNLLKCRFLGNLWNKRGCGLWQGLESLLGWLVDALVFADLCHLLDELSAVVADVGAPITTELLQGFELLPCVTHNAPAALSGKSEQTPALYTGAPGLPS